VRNFADRVIERSTILGSPIAAGFDPRVELLPRFLRPAAASRRAVAHAFVRHAELFFDGVAELVPAVKLQIAFFESLGPPGAFAYARCVELAAARGLLVIGDIKRGDIGTTATAYAEGHFTAGTRAAADAVTLNPYLGIDSLTPFLDRVASEGRGIFVLVRTSNPSAPDLQDARLADGRRLFERTADLVDEWGAPHRGTSGYSSVGMVVGATYAAELLALRAAHPHALLLVPGYGAQGGTADAIGDALDADGAGLLVAASRELMRDSAAAGDAKSAVAATRDAANRMRDALRRAFVSRRTP
jgi:orotidine-5'-phosphate decarboxylase